jgi:hypothetical protein
MADKTLKGRRPPAQNKILTSETLLATERVRINNLNRQRSRSMETRIAKYLKGTRQPMSGAIGRLKGDCEIPLDDRRTFYVECKLSSQFKHAKFHSIRMDHKWFIKMHVEARSMKSVFAIMVVHYHLQRDDYVFIRINDFMRVVYPCQSEELQKTLNALITDAIVIDSTVNKAGGNIKTFNLLKRDLDLCMITKDNMVMTRFIQHGESQKEEYLIFRISDFRDMIESVRENAKTI